MRDPEPTCGLESGRRFHPTRGRGVGKYLAARVQAIDRAIEPSLHFGQRPAERGQTVVCGTPGCVVGQADCGGPSVLRKERK